MRDPKSIDAVQALKSGNPDEQPDATIPVARKKQRPFVSLIITLMALGTISVILCESRSALTRSYVGLVAALGIVACGVFLVRRFIRLLAEEDKLQEQLLNENQAAVSPSQPNPAETQTNPPAPRPKPDRV